MEKPIAPVPKSFIEKAKAASGITAGGGPGLTVPFDSTFLPQSVSYKILNLFNELSLPQSRDLSPPQIDQTRPRTLVLLAQLALLEDQERRVRIRLA